MGPMTMNCPRFTVINIIHLDTTNQKFYMASDLDMTRLLQIR